MVKRPTFKSFMIDGKLIYEEKIEIISTVTKHETVQSPLHIAIK